MYDTNTNLTVNSSRLGGKYIVHRFTEYKIDIDLENDCDGFDFVLTNPEGVYTGLFSKFDAINIDIQNMTLINGSVDCVNYIWEDDDSKIKISGRDVVSPLVDNDAIPGTKTNVSPVSYISSKCAEYGIKFGGCSESIPAIKKLIIGTGESEISVINNILMESRMRIWAIYDTVYVGKWNTSAKPTYLFTRGVPREYSGIPIKSLSLKEDGTDTKSELRIYGSMSDGSEKVVGTAKNDWMISMGIKKRKVDRSSNNDSTSRYSANALRDVRESFRDNIILEIKVRGTSIVLPNRTARVIDSKTKINSDWFIKKVTYSKDMNGSLTTITMIPDDTTFEVLWNGQGTKKDGGITGTPKMTLDEILNKIKGQ